MTYRNQAELDAGLAKWTKILKIEDWEIILEYESRMKLDDANGLIAKTSDTKQAHVWLVDPESYERERKGTPFVYDAEKTLVHELIHIVLDNIQPPNEEGLLWTRYEQITEQLAKALVELDRAHEPVEEKCFLPIITLGELPASNRHTFPVMPRGIPLTDSEVEQIVKQKEQEKKDLAILQGIEKSAPSKK